MSLSLLPCRFIFVTATGHKRQREKPSPQEVPVKVKRQERSPKEKATRGYAQETIQEVYSEEGPLKCFPGSNEDPHGYSNPKRPRQGQSNAREETITEENEEILETILQDSVNLIQEIVKKSSAANRDCEFPDTKGAEEIRGQADKIIACLGNVVDSLHQFNHVCGDK